MSSYSNSSRNVGRHHDDRRGQYEPLPSSRHSRDTRGLYAADASMTFGSSLSSLSRSSTLVNDSGSHSGSHHSKSSNTPMGRRGDRKRFEGFTGTPHGRTSMNSTSNYSDRSSFKDHSSRQYSSRYRDQQGERPRKRVDYYAVLGVSHNASTNQITSASRDLALKHHPDRRNYANSADMEDAENQRISQIYEAYYVLSNKAKRQMYDMAEKAGHGYRDDEALSDA